MLKLFKLFYLMSKQIMFIMACVFIGQVALDLFLFQIGAHATTTVLISATLARFIFLFLLMGLIIFPMLQSLYGRSLLTLGCSRKTVFNMYLILLPLFCIFFTLLSLIAPYFSLKSSYDLGKILTPFMSNGNILLLISFLLVGSFGLINYTGFVTTTFMRHKALPTLLFHVLYCFVGIRLLIRQGESMVLYMLDHLYVLPLLGLPISIAFFIYNLIGIKSLEVLR